MDASEREQLVAEFRTYLEEADGHGAAAEPETPDLFTLLSELAAVKNEVRLESRQVKTALERFAETFDTLRRSNERLQQELDRSQARATRERHEVERPLLLELLDLRDRLQAGRDHAGQYRPGWLARRGGAGTFVARMAEGMDMNLRNLDGILSRHGVQALATLGRPFDPHTMRAVDTADEPSQARGTVVAEIRKGFVQEDALLRTAEVIVNKWGNDS
ncbi:nucleotide exchange factor GrpE [Aquisalimonas sp.]|uniref:nucleotide exchange factor GrpE n=1 Tax=Aquisalimonas sp. TaxID=1872621 RepID=UPI0025B86CB4|nr:nucleotide exchange factor GrpE [Aquisalimonas sp.]